MILLLSRILIPSEIQYLLELAANLQFFFHGELEHRKHLYIFFILLSLLTVFVYEAHYLWVRFHAICSIRFPINFGRPLRHDFGGPNGIILFEILNSLIKPLAEQRNLKQQISECQIMRQLERQLKLVDEDGR